MTDRPQHRLALPAVARLVAAVFVVLLLALANLVFPSLPTIGLDPSWQLVLNHARGGDFVLGTDLVYTYGPWGWLTTVVYHAPTFNERMLWEILHKTVAAALIVAAARKLAWPRRLALLAAALLVSPLLNDTAPMLLIAGLIVWSTQSRRHAATLAAAGVFIGFLALQKFTFLIMAASGLGLASIHLALLRRHREAVALVATTVLTFLIGWCAAGQPLAALPSFLQHASWIASAYNEAMFLDESNTVFLLGLIAALLFLFLTWDSPRIRHVPMALALTCFGFLNWKHGFVRADGHTLVFFSTMVFAGICAPWLNPAATRRRSVTSWSLTVVATAGLFAVVPALGSNIDQALREHLAAKTRALSNLERFQYHADRGVAGVRRETDLPTVRAAIGDRSIDQFGYQQAVLLLNRFNYRPRPVFQSFQAYSGPLARLNEAAYLTPSAPSFTLARLQAIDGRYPALEDAALLPRLILDHSLALSEKEFLLLQRHDSPSTINRSPLASGRLRYNADDCPLPASELALWARIDTPLSWLGRLRSLLYKPPEITLVVRDASSVTRRFRLIMPAAADGFLLSPLLLDTADLEKLVARREGRPVQSFRLEIDPHHALFFRSHATYEISSLSPLRLVSSASTP